MFCSRSIWTHLMRGMGAATLIALAIYLGTEQPWLFIPLVVGAVLLLRGCPMCWLFGLVETINNRRNARSKMS